MSDEPKGDRSEKEQAEQLTEDQRGASREEYTKPLPHWTRHDPLVRALVERLEEDKAKIADWGEINALMRVNCHAHGWGWDNDKSLPRNVFRVLDRLYEEIKRLREIVANV